MTDRMKISFDPRKDATDLHSVRHRSDNTLAAYWLQDARTGSAEWCRFPAKAFLGSSRRETVPLPSSVDRRSPKLRPSHDAMGFPDRERLQWRTIGAAGRMVADPATAPPRPRPPGRPSPGGQRVARMHKIVTDEIQPKQCISLPMILRRSLDWAKC